MKKLSDLLKFLRDKSFVKTFESNPKNYENGTCLATTQYLNAVTDINLYK